MPKLSVIIPVYNAEKFLHRSVDSVLNQTFKDLELILVNDGSKDKSLSICREYEKKDARVIVIDKENEGAGPTRNKGIETAKGEYVAFPDSDDWLDLNCYEICLNKIEEVNADLLVFGVKTHVYNDKENVVSEIIEEKVQPVFYNCQEDCRKHFVDLHRSCNMNSPCNKIYRREILIGKNVRFPDMRRMQDGVFNMHYFDKISSIVVIEDNFFNRTWHNDEFEIKKLPTTYLSCIINYHKTAISILGGWGKDFYFQKKFFDDKFIEIIEVAETKQIDLKKRHFKEIYQHVRFFNNNAYLHEFLKKYKNKTKTQIAMRFRLNFVLTMKILIGLKRR